MTRDEAIKLIEKSLTVETLIDAWVALGMLKLDEPKSVEKKYTISATAKSTMAGSKLK